MPALVPVKRNPLLTKDYLDNEDGLGGLAKAVDRLISEIYTERFLTKSQGILGGIKVYPPEKTAAQLKRKMGRPTKYHRPMTAKERKRRERGQEVFHLRKYSGILGNLGTPSDAPYQYPGVPWRQFKFGK
jgi:hypothetical protein